MASLPELVTGAVAAGGVVGVTAGDVAGAGSPPPHAVVSSTIDAAAATPENKDDVRRFIRKF